MTAEYQHTAMTTESTEDYEAEMEELRRLFPNASFTISLHLHELDDIVSPTDMIIVKISYDCYCYKLLPTPNNFVPEGLNPHRPSDYVTVKASSARGVTVKDAVSAMVDYGLDTQCNHCFLEGFYQTDGSEIQFDACFTS